MTSVNWEQVIACIGDDGLARLRAAGYEVVRAADAQALAAAEVRETAVVGWLHRVAILLGEAVVAADWSTDLARCPIPGCGWRMRVGVLGVTPEARQDAAWWAGYLLRDHVTTAHGPKGGRPA
jgi:hypothetical protein